jgi:hypothetical protein
MTIEFVIDDMNPTIHCANTLLGKLGAEGQTTHSRINSVEDQLSDQLQKDLRFLATTFNCAQRSGIESINVEKEEWLRKGEYACNQLDHLISLNDQGLHETLEQENSEISYNAIVHHTGQLVTSMRGIGATGNTPAQVIQSLYDQFNPPDPICNALRNTFKLRGKAMHDGIDSPNFDALLFLNSVELVTTYLHELEKVTIKVKPSIDTVMQLSIMIEKKLRSLGAKGLGIHELTSSLEGDISENVAKKLHFIGKIRNLCAHGEHHLIGCSTEQFVQASTQIHNSLTALDTARQRINDKATPVENKDEPSFWDLVIEIIRALAKKVADIMSTENRILSAQV